jgi:predicted AAA+ superfamily ATPase
LDFPISFWRTASGAEVDLILGDAEVAIEIKSSENAGSSSTKGLHLFLEENKSKKKIIVSRDPAPKKLDSGILIMPWKHFCDQLWDGDII